MSQRDFEWDGLQTKALHAADACNTTAAISPPIWQTTTFQAPSAEQFAGRAAATMPAEFYTRYGNPNHEQVATTLAALEGGEAALVTSSGMGAIFATLMSQLKSGDHIVAQRNHYAGVTALLADWTPRWGIESTLVDQTSTAAFAAALRPNTRVIYLETPTNPLLQITDLRAVASLAKQHGILTIVDNTFATPINQRPLALGIDVVVHSATKYLGGHHDAMAGAVVSSRAHIEAIWSFALLAGATLSPFDSWLLLRGLRTLGLRVERHNQNAMAVARFLEAHAKVARVNYPGLPTHPQHELARSQMSGFTGMLSVELRGGYAAAERLISSLELVARAASLGGVETLIVHPAAMWSSQLSADQRNATGISDGLVRISIGVEDERDLLRDFEQALANA